MCSSIAKFICESSKLKEMENRLDMECRVEVQVLVIFVLLLLPRVVKRSSLPQQEEFGLLILIIVIKV